MREELCEAARPGKGGARLKNQQKTGLELGVGGGQPEMRLHGSWASLVNHGRGLNSILEEYTVHQNAGRRDCGWFMYTPASSYLYV